MKCIDKYEHSINVVYGLHELDKAIMERSRTGWEVQSMSYRGEGAQDMAVASFQDDYVVVFRRTNPEWQKEYNKLTIASKAVSEGYRWVHYLCEQFGIEMLIEDTASALAERANMKNSRQDATLRLERRLLDALREYRELTAEDQI